MKPVQPRSVQVWRTRGPWLLRITSPLQKASGCLVGTLVLLLLLFSRFLNSFIDDRLYSAILCSWADSLHLHVILHAWLAFYSTFLNSHQNGVLTALTWLVLRETAAVSARSVYTIQPCTVSIPAKPHMQGACVFNCNLPPALWAEWQGSFTCYCSNTGAEQIPK